MIATVSASSIKDFRDCPRKWYTRKIVGIKSPPTAATTRGTRLHALFEGSVGKGRPTRHPRVLAALEEVTWLPASARLVEAPLVNWTLGGVQVAGRHDLAQIDENTAIVTDLKSTKSFRYALTSIALATDPQAIIYAHDMFVRAPSIDSVTLEWIYTRTVDKPVAKAVRTGVDRAAVYAEVEKLDDIAVEMVRVSELPEHEVPQNTAACAKYGGCPYFTRCFPAAKVEKNMAVDWEEPPRATLTLMIDVACAKGPHKTQRLEDYLAPLLEEVAREAKVPDFRMVPFAGWKGKLGEKIRARPPSGIWYGMRSNEATNVAIEVLTPVAGEIYIGTR